MPLPFTSPPPPPERVAEEIAAACNRNVPGHAKWRNQAFCQPLGRHISKSLPDESRDIGLSWFASRERDGAGRWTVYASGTPTQCTLAGIEQTADPDYFPGANVNADALIFKLLTEPAQAQDDRSGRCVERCRPSW